MPPYDVKTMEMAMPHEVRGVERRITPEETIALTLEGTWSAASVYVDPRGEANAAGGFVRVYAITQGVRALAALWSITSGTAAQYMGTVATQGADRFEVTIQSAGAATQKPVRVAAMGFGSEPGGGGAAQPAGGAASGDATSLRGRTIATAAPADGNVYMWNGTAWTPVALPAPPVIPATYALGGDLSGTTADARVERVYPTDGVTEVRGSFSFPGTAGTSAVADAGDIRLRSTGGIYARNNANTANIPLAEWTATTLQVGSATPWSTATIQTANYVALKAPSAAYTIGAAFIVYDTGSGEAFRIAPNSGA